MTLEHAFAEYKNDVFERKYFTSADPGFIQRSVCVLLQDIATDIWQVNVRHMTSTLSSGEIILCKTRYYTSLHRKSGSRPSID
jgi:hypothetical protein